MRHVDLMLGLMYWLSSFLTHGPERPIQHQILRMSFCETRPEIQYDMKLATSCPTAGTPARLISSASAPTAPHRKGRRQSISKAAPVGSHIAEGKVISEPRQAANTRQRTKHTQRQINKVSLGSIKNLLNGNALNYAQQDRERYLRHMLQSFPQEKKTT